jgi:predicted alpha/beta-hydrolase family hydrolase
MPPKRRRTTDSAPAPEPKRRFTRSSTKADTATAPDPQVDSSGAEYETSREKRIRKSKNSPPKKKTKQEAKSVDEQSATATTTTPPNVSTLSSTHADIKKPIQCHQYTPTPYPSDNPPTLLFTHGAGGTLSADAVVNFCTGFSTSLPVLAFQGSMNLRARTKGFHACIYELQSNDGKSTNSLLLGGRSMGARAAVITAGELIDKSGDEGKEFGIRLILVSYPLQGPKDVRDQILLDLAESVSVLFITGDKDAMCPLDLLNETRSEMKAKSQLVVVRGANHGMHVKPARVEKEVGEETGRVAAQWVDRKMKADEDVVYIGEEE